MHCLIVDVSLVWVCLCSLPGGVAQLVERVLYHSTRRAVPERSWVQSLLPTTEVEPGLSAFGGTLFPVLQLISPVCKTGTVHPFCVDEIARGSSNLRCRVPGGMPKVDQLRE
jgi:hypothetical protein